MYQQIDGIAMGSPLGCIFANFYMAKIETQVLNQLHPPPAMYARYIDDTIILVRDEDQILNMKNMFEEHSVLKFTYEIGYSKLPFLDVFIEKNEDNTFTTSVYVKPTNTGELLNFNSECPERYKKGVITNMLNRAYKCCSNAKLFDNEIIRLRKVFANNNFPIKLIEECIRKFKDKKSRNNDEIKKNKINIFYENQMSELYKKDERILKTIIQNNVKPISDEDEIQIMIYYKNTKSKNLIMKNNLSDTKDKMQTSWTVYKYTCPSEDCELPNPTYIGQTRNTLRKRLEQHTKDGAIKDHQCRYHRKEISQPEIEQCTSSIKVLPDLKRLVIYEALLIILERPDLNRQKDNFINPLKLFGRTTPSTLATTNARPPATTHGYNLRSQ